jgi:tetratricopeptide (TPR) repeat protein
LRFLMGELNDARADLERALADYDELRDEGLQTAFAVDIRSNTLAHLGQVAWFLGEPEEARRFTDEATGRAQESGQPGSHAVALYNRLLIGALCGEAEAVLPAAEEMRALAGQHELKFWRAIASTYADWARVRLGESRAEAFRTGLGAYAELGARLQQAALLPLLADVELVDGRRDEALSAVERGLAFTAETGLDAWRPWLLRKRGDALADIDAAGATTAWREALSVAGPQGSRALALLAALALARLHQSTGSPLEAYDALSPALAGFSPTPEFPAIAAAQALLSALGADEAVTAALRRREVH